MLLKICTCDRKRYLLVVKSTQEFQAKVKQLLNLQGDFKCVLEEDGSEIIDEVLEAVIDAKEKVGVIMIIVDGQQWSKAEDTQQHAAGLQEPHGERPPLPSLSAESPVQPQHGAEPHTGTLFQDIRAVLHRNPKGQKVLAEYDRHRTLSSESRQTLVKIVVAQLVHDYGMYPAKEHKMQLASAIITALPGLKDASGVTGYEHFFSESNGQTGYIQDRLKRARRSLPPEAQQRPRNKVPQQASEIDRASDTGSCSLPTGDAAASELTDAEAEKLRMDCVYANPATDKAVVLGAMCKTAAVRQHWIRTLQPSITEVMSQYPRLEDMPCDLLDIDFRLHYPDSLGAFVSNFPSMVPRVIAAARLSRKTAVVELVREYDVELHQPVPASRDLMYAVLCLLHLLQSSSTRHKARISSVELESQLLTFRPQQTSIDLFLEEKKRSTHKQPFLLCLGSRENPSSYFLVLDGKAVCLGECGVVRAVDCLFKSHFVYWVDYGKPLALFMEFLQKLIYKIDCTKLTASVRELHNSMTALTDNADQ